MTGPEVLDVARDAIYTLIIVSAPVMLVGLVVGVAISLLQALTQIQEMTIAFVPKILAIFLSLLIALPFMAEKMHAEMLRIAARKAGVEPVIAEGDGAFYAPKLDFVLKDAIGAVTETGKKSDTQTRAMVNGKSNMVDVVTAVAETEVAIDAVVAVRDKVIAAYEEIMKMPI